MLHHIKLYIIVAVVIVGALLGGYFFLSNYRANVLQQKLRSRSQTPRQALGFHYSYFSQAEFFDKAFQTAALTPITPDLSVTGIVVNHHLLAGSFIAETMGVVASSEPTTVILVSPNHFNAGSADVISSLYDWQTPYGNLPANQKVVRTLQQQGVTIEEQPFEKEHGISGIVAFIKKTMPNASVVPIILKDKTSSEEIRSLTKTIIDSAPSNSGRVIMVSSVDFSHYLPAPVADFHDLLSKHVLRSFDLSNIGSMAEISRLEIDSQPSIRLLLQYMTARDTEKFTLTNHSNSSVVLNDFEITNGTSYVTGYFSPGNHIKDEHQTLLVTGDIYNSAGLPKILDRQKENYIFSSSFRMFMGSDQTFVRVAGSDNNQNLIDRITGLGVTDIEINGTLMDSPKINTANPFTVITVRAKTDALSSTMTNIIDRIKKQNAHSVVVSIDWQGLSHMRQQQIAQLLIDAGAVLIVGHSNSVLPVEQYHQGLIAYGLGDMVPANLQQAVQSTAIGLDRDEGGVSYNFFPMQYKQGSVMFLKPSEDGIVMAQLHLKQPQIKISY